MFRLIYDGTHGGPMTEGNRTRIKQPAEILTFGGGKGGTGKSFLTSAFAVELARAGSRVILIDADLGAPNIHTWLGLRNPRVSLTHFFERKKELPELVLKTGLKNLSLVAGDIHTLSSTGFKHFLMRKFYRQIKTLRADYILIDVGAGSGTQVLDTFLLANRKIAVLNPDPLCVDNFYQFIKNALFRRISQALKPYGIKDMTEQIWKIRENYNIKNIWDLFNWFMINFPFSRSIIEKEVTNFSIDFVMNQVRNTEDIHLGQFIKSGFKKYLNLDCRYIGYIAFRSEIAHSASSGRPFMVTFAKSAGVQEIQICLKNLLERRESKLPKI
jgi:flagellar biosynthesis protein FlhG